ncbi:hypothetical protein COY24_03650 [Candidatus Uhrbacteria bacterium CG_4_10_14_0_2_um_filter_41_21]|nr:MAG: hypothetical protein COY24_03650 [Candidatus Uhrbacteria bacterium CG_4_10_14_0_2_um_filter_41_21]
MDSNQKLFRGYWYQHSAGASEPREFRGEWPVEPVNFQDDSDIIKIPVPEQQGATIPFRYTVIVTYIGKSSESEPLIKITALPHDGPLGVLLGVKFDGKTTLRERIDRAIAHMLTAGVIPGSIIAVCVYWAKEGARAQTFAGFSHGTARLNQLMRARYKEEVEKYLKEQPWWKRWLGITALSAVDKKAPLPKQPIPENDYSPWDKTVEVGAESPIHHALTVMVEAVQKTMYAYSRLPAIIEHTTGIRQPYAVTIIPMTDLYVRIDDASADSRQVSMGGLTVLDGHSKVDEAAVGRFDGLRRIQQQGSASMTIVPDLDDVTNRQRPPINLAKREKDTTDK